MIVLERVVENLQNDGFSLIPLAVSQAEAIKTAFEAAGHFFRAPLGEKTPNKICEDCGYRPMGVEYSQSSDRPDAVESFTACSRTSASATTLASASARRLYERMLTVIDVLEPIAEALTIQLAERFSGRSYRTALSGAFRQWSCLQMNYSRPADITRPFINELHEDGHLITIACSTGGGLEVQRKDGFLMPISRTCDEAVIMPGEIAFLLSGGEIEPLYHCVRPEPNLHERMSLLFFGDIDPKLCDPWVLNDRNMNVDIGKHVLTNAARFGVPGFTPE